MLVLKQSLNFRMQLCILNAEDFFPAVVLVAFFQNDAQL